MYRLAFVAKGFSSQTCWVDNAAAVAGSEARGTGAGVHGKAGMLLLEASGQLLRSLDYFLQSLSIFFVLSYSKVVKSCQFSPFCGLEKDRSWSLRWYMDSIGKLGAHFSLSSPSGRTKGISLGTPLC
jgi:hypothetical protein